MAQLTSSFGPDVVYEYVYRSVKSGPLAGKLSALVVTSSGDVYGAGVNTLVRCFTYHDEYPMLEGGGPELSSWVKIERLCGLGIRKIIVGPGFCAAVTNDDEMLTWGQGKASFLGKQAIVMFEVNPLDTTCTLCKTPHIYDENIIGGVAFKYCQYTQAYPVYTAEHPPPDDVKVKRFLRARGDIFIINCTKCMEQMTSLLVNFIPLIHCPDCNLLWDLDENVGVLGEKEGIPTSERIHQSIEDIAPFADIWLLERGNRLSMRSFEVIPCSWELPVKNSGNVRITAVYSARHSVVRTSNGDLCRIEFLIRGEPALEKIRLPAKVVKICCGWIAIACLLEDHSLWVVFDGVHLPIQLLLPGKKGSFKDIAAAHYCDTFYVQADRQTEIKIADPVGSGEKIIFKVSDASCGDVLMNEVCSQSIPIDVDIQSTPSPHQSLKKLSLEHIPFLLPPFLRGLYGEKQLSDLTLILTNESFPAHRCVLLSTSNYFRRTLACSTAPHVTLEMSLYNPKAYKCLLKYFYQREPDDLDLDGLFDLYVIADSYKETDIVSDVEEKIIAKIDSGNCLHAYALSQMLNIDKIRIFSESVIRSSGLKDKLLEMALQDPVLFLTMC